MATAEKARTRGIAASALVAAVLLTGAVFLLARPDSAGSPAAPDSVSVSSSTRHEFGALADLRAASDLVIAGRVVAGEPGRVFGGVDDAGTRSGQGIRSRVLTIRVESVLSSRPEAATLGSDAVVLVEEESTLLDGSPLVVDGVQRARVGDDGFWFLVASGDPEFPGYAVVNSQGRYLRERGSGDALRGADRSDDLVRSVEGLGASGLTRAVTSA